MDIWAKVEVSVRTLSGIFLIALPAVYFTHIFEQEWRGTALETIAGEIKQLRESPCYKQTKISSRVEKIVNDKLEAYEADKTGMPDFALETIGGCVLTTRNTKSYERGPESFSIFGIPLSSTSHPKSVIQASVMPGECWAFQGSEGTVVLQLAIDINVSHISLEHISRKLSPTRDIPSAPREFSFCGLKSENDDEGHEFGSYVYDSDGSPVQTFEVQVPSKKLFRVVEVKFLSNYGHPDYTCVYRIRIHGSIPK